MFVMENKKCRFGMAGLSFTSTLTLFFASVEQVSNPNLKGKPVIVCGVPIEKSVVTAASYEAKKFGIKGRDACISRPNNYCHKDPVNPDKYLHYSICLLQICHHFTQRVEPYSIDEAFLDITGTAEEPLLIARKIKSIAKSELGLVVSIGIAPNKLIAKIASDL